MKMKLSFRIWLLIICVVIAAIIIVNPKAFTGKVMVKEVIVNSN